MKKYLSVFVKMFLVVAMFAFGVMGIIGCSSGGGGGTPVPTATHTAAPTASHSVAPTATPTASGTSTASPTGSPTGSPTTPSSDYTITGTGTWDASLFASNEGYLLFFATKDPNFQDRSKIGSFESSFLTSLQISAETKNYSLTVPISIESYYIVAFLSKKDITVEGVSEGDLMGAYPIGGMPEALSCEASGINIFLNNTIHAGIDTSYSIAGTITGLGSDSAYVTVTNEGGSNTSRTSGTGTYEQGGLVTATYIVCPNLENYYFTPEYQIVTIESGSGSTFGANFAATKYTNPTISGTYVGMTGSGINPHLYYDYYSVDHGFDINHAPNTSSHTDRSSGDLVNFMITIEAFSAEGTLRATVEDGDSASVSFYTPTHETVNIIDGTSVSGITIEGMMNFSGTIESIIGTGGVTLEIRGYRETALPSNLIFSEEVVTPNNGSYSFVVPYFTNALYYITPTAEPYSFWPDMLPFFAPTSEANFIEGYSLSGSIEGSSLAGVTVSLTGEATTRIMTTETAGTFVFTGLPYGDYYVTCSKHTSTFDPATASGTISGGPTIIPPISKID